MKAVNFFQRAVLAGTLLTLAQPVSADILFSLLPSDGNVSGPPGSVVGWGYSLTDTDPSDWYVSTAVNSDSFSNGTPTLLFDFPILSPGDTVTEAFDPVNSIGLFELQWDLTAPIGFVNSGNFVLSGQWWTGDPFNGGQFIADAPDISLPYTATVTSSVNTPEPSSVALLASGIAIMIGWRMVRNRHRFRLSTPATGAAGGDVRGPSLEWSPGSQIRRACRSLLIFFLAFSCLAGDDVNVPQSSAKDSGITRQQGDEILNELKQIRQLLERQTRPAVAPSPIVPQTGKLRMDGGFSLGSSDAPVTIVEFTDYECLFCRQFESTTFAEIRKKYVDTGKVRFVIRDFPLGGHPDAMPAAEAARCAGDQGKFWPMHDALFGDSGKPGQKMLIDHAEALKLDVEVFQSCLESGKHKPDIQSDMLVASSLQIMATPSFLIGKTRGEEVSGAIIIGAQPFSVFEAKLKEAEAAH